MRNEVEKKSRWEGYFEDINFKYDKEVEKSYLRRRKRRMKGASMSILKGQEWRTNDG